MQRAAMESGSSHEWSLLDGSSTPGVATRRCAATYGQARRHSYAVRGSKNGSVPHPGECPEERLS